MECKFYLIELFSFFKAEKGGKLRFRLASWNKMSFTRNWNVGSLRLIFKSTLKLLEMPVWIFFFRILQGYYFGFSWPEEQWDSIIQVSACLCVPHVQRRTLVLVETTGLPWEDFVYISIFLKCMCLHACICACVNGEWCKVLELADLNLLTFLSLYQD